MFQSEKSLTTLPHNIEIDSVSLINVSLILAETGYKSPFIGTRHRTGPD